MLKSLYFRNYLPCILLIASLFSTNLFSQTFEILQPEFSIPLLEKKPHIDGKISEEEWSDCFRSIGLMKNRDSLADREAIVWLGCDGEKFYLAVKSEVPAIGSILQRVKPAGNTDRAVHRDDSVEIWLAPSRNPARKNNKYYQIAINSLGALYDVCFDPDDKQLPQQPGWRVNLEQASSVDKESWQLEIAIPLSELELEEEDLLLPWKIRVARNWKQPGIQTELAARIGGFADLHTMTKINWVQEGVLLRMLSLRSSENSVNVVMEANNKTKKNMEFYSEIFHRTSDNPHFTQKQNNTLPPGEKMLFTVKETLNRGRAETKLYFADKAQENVFFQRSFAWQVEENPERWKAVSEDIRAATLSFAYYPSFNKIKARLDVNGLEKRSAIKEAILQLSNSENKVLAEMPFPTFSADWCAEMLMETPELASGEYNLAAYIKGEQVPSEPLKQTFIRKTFPWENQELGLYEGIIPPFTPLQLVDNNKLKLVLRELEFNSQGLWQQVKSLDEELLAAPIHFDVKIAGKNQNIESLEKLNFPIQKDHEFSFQSSWKAGSVNAKIQGVCEMDGLTKINLELEQTGNEIVEKFDLVIPMKKKFASLLHACGPGLRSNYAGYIPDGDGIVWDSRKTGSHLVGYFIPYIWFGREGRGIAWFAESDKDWLYDDAKPSQSIINKGEYLELRIHFVNKAAALQRKRVFSFGMQVSPTKPMPGEPNAWRNWVSRTTDEGKEPENWRYSAENEQQHWRNWVSRTNRRFSERAYTHFMLAGSSSWGTDAGHAFIYPVDRNFFVYDLLKETREKGERNLQKEEEWFKVYDPSLSKEQIDSRKNHIRWATRNLAGQPDAVVPYTDPRASVFNEEFATYQDEWLSGAYSSRKWNFDNPRAAIAYQISPGKSFQDYHLHYLKKMLDTFADAIYFDNTFLVASNDIMLGAYVADDGTVRPAVDIYNMREHIKRTQILTWQNGKNWLASMSHMTNTQIIPINTWCGTILDWEWKYGSDDFQKRFSRDMIRTTSIGVQSGSVPFVLGSTGIRGNFDDERKNFLTRSMLGTSLVHEIQNLSCGGLIGEIYAKLYSFGYGSEKCKVYRYWDENFPLTITNGDAEALLLVNGNEAMILIVNFADDAEINLAFNNNKLKLKTNGKFQNLETNEILDNTKEFSVKLYLPKNDFVLLQYK